MYSHTVFLLPKVAKNESFDFVLFCSTQRDRWLRREGEVLTSVVAGDKKGDRYLRGFNGRETLLKLRVSRKRQRKKRGSRCLSGRHENVRDPRLTGM